MKTLAIASLLLLCGGSVFGSTIQVFANYADWSKTVHTDGLIISNAGIGGDVSLGPNSTYDGCPNGCGDDISLNRFGYRVNLGGHVIVCNGLGYAFDINTATPITASYWDWEFQAQRFFNIPTGNSFFGMLSIDDFGGSSLEFQTTNAFTIADVDAAMRSDTVTPEPISILLLLTGLCCVVLVDRLRA